MSANLSNGAHGELGCAPTTLLTLRCACGATVDARREDELIELARLHFAEFHPDLGADVPADAILAMAEQKGELR